MKPGDVVRLKSGGPAMTVIQVLDTTVQGGAMGYCSGPSALCVWFYDDGGFEERWFSQVALKQ